MKKQYYKPNRVKARSKYYTPNGSTITEGHYTKFNEHPEDRIYRDKEYIQRLQRHIDSVYDLLAADLRLNEQGTDWLFDYVYNSDDNDIEFEEYLDNYSIKYCDIVR
jgi:hypothetical protein